MEPPNAMARPPPLPLTRPRHHVSSRNMAEPYTCDSPFESGGGLCKTCRLLPESATGRKCGRMVARSPAMTTLMKKASLVANADASVVLRGESGAGKEVVARALHANSPRKLKPFVAVNCAALPADLLESELFGHAKGAFTGAHSARKGLFEAADGGTLFLDEIAELPLQLQAKLLRALQDGEIRRVGEVEPSMSTCACCVRRTRISSRRSASGASAKISTSA
jgi:transcriptional regulator of acetoin/glycerol metabolism